MNNRREKLEAIFEAAAALETGAQRHDYLDRACPDAGLRSEVESLLAAMSNPDSLFGDSDTDPATILTETPLLEQPGTMIGRYKLLQKVGEGGMGVVYMAEQTEPVTRKVALKIIKLGMDTRQVVARFEAERQALAMMDHPNIAKVLDAGSTDSGRPYFVMELVRGVPITEYCDKNKLGTQERLNLFIPVCQAIQHAHQKGVIHRDIKPSNVMVTLHDGNAVPKVIDFGIAKATNQKLTEKTLFTNYATMIGTPAYMSPEQAEMSGLDIDTRTDVYSLGVLLYELLTGTTPFSAKELLSLGYGEIQKVIAEREPPKPSTRLSTMQNEERTVVAKNRSMEVSGLGTTLRGDLDWIVMKSLEKDRTHRYETANGLVADIQRHLNDEPVSAAAPTFGYQLRKFARRNRKYARMAAAIAALLLVAALLATWQAVRATRAERAAIDEAARATAAQQQARENASRAGESAQRAQDYEHRALKESAANAQVADAIKNLLRRLWSTSTDGLLLLEANSGPVLSELKGQPELELEISLIMGRQMHAFTLANSGSIGEKRLEKKTVELYTRALLLAQSIYPPNDPRAAAVMTETGDALHHVGQFVEAEKLLRAALEIQNTTATPGNEQLALTHSLLAIVLQQSGQTESAAEIFGKALAFETQSQVAKHGPEAADTRIAALKNFWAGKDYHAVEYLLTDGRDLSAPEAKKMLEMRELRLKTVEAAEAALVAEQKKLEVGKSTAVDVLNREFSVYEARAYLTGDFKDLLAFREAHKSIAERLLAETKKKVEVGLAAPLEQKEAEAQVAKATYELMKLQRLLNAGSLP